MTRGIPLSGVPRFFYAGTWRGCDYGIAHIAQFLFECAFISINSLLFALF